MHEIIPYLAISFAIAVGFFAVWQVKRLNQA